MNEVEDIQNRVRNTLGSIQTLHDICEILVSEDADSEKSTQIYNYLVKSDIIKNTQASINKLIILAKAADMKIDDENFSIEDYIKTNNITL